jgi:hypothetical protein
MSNNITLAFQTRRQNTNDSDDQFRIWAPREETNRLAAMIPELQNALDSNETWSEPNVAISWNNGTSPELTVGAYENQSGELSFTASKKCELFNFVACRHTEDRHEETFSGTCSVDAQGISSISLDITL